MNEPGEGGGPGGAGAPVAAASNFGKFGVPKPVAASHPGVHAQPCVVFWPDREMALVPTVTSLKAEGFW